MTPKWHWTIKDQSYSTASYIRVACHLNQVYWMTPEWSWSLRNFIGTMYSEAQISIRFLLGPTKFKLRRLLLDNSTERPRNDLENYYGFRGNIYVLPVSPCPNFDQCCSAASHCWVTGYFETCPPNDPRYSCTLRAQRYPMQVYIFSTNTPESQIALRSIRLGVWQALFELQAISRQVPRTTQNDFD